MKMAASSRYKRRWIVERTNAWLGQFRRLLVRHEHLLSIYYAFFYLACFWIALRRHCCGNGAVGKPSPLLQRTGLAARQLGGVRPRRLGHIRLSKKFIAKFSMKHRCIYNVVKAAYVAMRLASLAGPTVISGVHVKQHSAKMCCSSIALTASI